jgi:hypothetical protein
VSARQTAILAEVEGFASPRSLRLQRLILPGDPLHRLSDAASELSTYANKLASAATELPPKHHGLALMLTSDWRIYGFERNRSRWPDNRFYMLDRGYGHWRGHKVSFTAEQLEAFGLRDWDRRAVAEAHDADMFPLQADSFHYNPRRRLPELAAVVSRISAHLDQVLERRYQERSAA